jgi:hypothetical protein
MLSRGCRTCCPACLPTEAHCSGNAVPPAKLSGGHACHVLSYQALDRLSLQSFAEATFLPTANAATWAYPSPICHVRQQRRVQFESPQADQRFPLFCRVSAKSSRLRTLIAPFARFAGSACRPFLDGLLPPELDSSNVRKYGTASPEFLHSDWPSNHPTPIRA